MTRLGGGTGWQGCASHDGAWTTVPPSATHLACDTSSSHSTSGSSSTNAPVALWARQQTTVVGGGVEAHGFGRQLVAVVTVPPAAVQLAAVSSSHSPCPSSP